MDRYYPVTCEAIGLTPITAPITLAVPTEDALLADVEIIIPDGHVGLTGIRLRSSGQQILPWGNDSWLIGNQYQRVFTMNTEIGATSLSLQFYNTDFRRHRFYVRFHLQDLNKGAQVGLTVPQQSAVQVMGLSSGSSL